MKPALRFARRSSRRPLTGSRFPGRLVPVSTPPRAAPCRAAIGSSTTTRSKASSSTARRWWSRACSWPTTAIPRPTCSMHGASISGTCPPRTTVPHHQRRLRNRRASTTLNPTTLSPLPVMCDAGTAPSAARQVRASWPSIRLTFGLRAFTLRATTRPCLPLRWTTATPCRAVPAAESTSPTPTLRRKVRVSPP